MRKKHFTKCLMMICLIWVLRLMIPMRTASAQKTSFTEQTQLITFLRDQRSSAPSQIDFTCGNDFYKSLTENGFYDLYQILIKAGIDYGQVMISYNDFRHYIQISNVIYTNYAWAECDDLDDLRNVLPDLANHLDGFILLCPDTFADALSEGSTLHRLLVRSGIESYRLSFSPDAGIIRVTDINYLPVPYAVVEDYAQFSSAVAGFESMNIHDFYILLEPDLFARIDNDPQQYTIMIGSSRLGGYRSATDPVSCSIRFSEVEFTDVPREICRTISDVPEAIRRMGAAGIRDFELIFPDTSIFRALYQDDFALLMTLEANAGMSGGKIAYSSGEDRIIFTDAEITSDAVMLASLSDAIAYTEAEAAAGKTDIHLFCNPSLFDALMGDLREFAVVHNGMNRIYDLIAHAGIFNYDLSSIPASHVINIHINQLFPGKAIVLAASSGDFSSLSARELELWTTASQIAASLRSSDPLQTARSIHDWLCANVIYADDEWTDEDDNAIGAILNGRANCDGYSDAFYLIGSLAGLNIRYQHGDSYYKDPVQLASTSTHLWNLLEINGQWHMVDVTWDDEPYGWSYHWFNVGRNVADEMHFWNEDMTVPLADY